MSNYSWMRGRGAGVLLHISSLPSAQGIGSFGGGADLFLKFLSKSGMTYWQICPMQPTGFGDSPYQCFSAFAGNPYFIDCFELVKAKLLDDGDAAKLLALPSNKCDFGAIYNTIPALLKKAAQNPNVEKLNFEKSFKAFCDENAKWLDDYANFTALKEKFGGKIWSEWPDEFKFRKFKSLDAETATNARAVKLIQWIFFGQYTRLKTKAAELGIEIIGDMPIFVSYDSADVWANPALFDLDENLAPNHVAGVGPDYFSPKGQLWGNPLYAWEKSKKLCYNFWEERLAQAFKMFDVLRLDHFRGFADFWEIPANAKDACSGEWKPGPGLDFFNHMRKIFPTQKFIAEDLGILSETSVALRDALNIPSMSVLQFAFGGDASNGYLPHNMHSNLVCYTGTHDNDTSVSWYNSADEKTKDQFRKYFSTPADAPNWDMIHAALISVAKIAVIPMQDVLGLGDDARMNTPGEPAGNWQWRISESALKLAMSNQASFVRSLCEVSGRI